MSGFLIRAKYILIEGYPYLNEANKSNMLPVISYVKLKARGFSLNKLFQTFP